VKLPGPPNTFSNPLTLLALGFGVVTVDSAPNRHAGLVHIEFFITLVAAISSSLFAAAVAIRWVAKRRPKRDAPVEVLLISRRQC
jgi:hypothetical protein